MKPLAALSLLLFAPLSLGATASATQPVTTQLLHTAAKLKGEDVLALPDRAGSWLVTSANRGLMLVTADSQAKPLVSGNLEALDARSTVVIDGETRTLISAIDKNSGATLLFALDTSGDTLTELARVDSATALPDTQCLYRDPVEQHISLFAVDAQGMIHQRIVYDASTQKVVNIPVRSFVGVPDAQACTVDDDSGALYVAEETLGVWRYAANPETDASRDPIALVKPHGALPGEVADLASTANGELWVLTAEPAMIQRYIGDNLADSFRLQDLEEAKTLAVARHNDALTFALFDEAADSYRQADVSVTAPKADRQPAAAARVYPTAETAAVARFGDAADDPAIWLNAKNPKDSLIIGTDKREGLKVYGLDGALRQSLNIGRLNNVDLIPSARVNGRQQPLIAASNRNTNSISLFTIDRRAKVQHLGDIATNLDEVYGLCMYSSASGNHVFVNDTDGRYQQYRVDADDGISGERVREFRLPSQPEGCAVDTTTGHLYMGEEKAGIWMTEAEPDGAAPTLIIAVDEQLAVDVEGMDIYADGDRRYLVVSSQGNDSYVVYGLWRGFPRVGHFQIGANLRAGVDGVSETDGLAVTSTPLPGYPKGLLVVQDGRNRMPEQPQNFKLVDWRAVESVVDLTAGETRK